MASDVNILPLRTGFLTDRLAIGKMHEVKNLDTDFVL